MFLHLLNRLFDVLLSYSFCVRTRRKHLERERERKREGERKRGWERERESITHQAGHKKHYKKSRAHKASH